MLEANLETDVIKWAKARKGRAEKLKIEGQTGFPDRTLFLPGGEVLIPELKRPKKNKRSQNQIDWVNWLVANGFAAGFCESLDDVVALYERYYV